MNTSSSEEREPRVTSASIRQALLDKYASEERVPVRVISAESGVSARTIYRILRLDTSSTSLDYADRVLIAADCHLIQCKLIMPNGKQQWYYE